MRIFKRNLVLIVVSFILQGAWEYIVCGVYYAVEIIPNMYQLMVEATVGDVLITMIVFNAIMLMSKSSEWQMNKRNVLGILLYGFAAAMYFESRGLWLERWGYSEEMPLLLDTNIGILPILQFVILIPLSIYLENRIFLRKTNTK